MDRWLDYAKPNLKPGTIKRYREAITIYIKPHLGDANLHKLDALTVQSTYSKWLREGTSPTTVNLVHSVLLSAFKRAVKWQLLTHNIIRDVDAPRIEAKEVEVWTPDEVRALLSAASEDRNGATFTIALSTGMRGGEILALQKPDIDLARGALQVRRTLILNGSSVGTPKRVQYNRQIDVS